jgi:hypothetical protein
LLTYSGVIAAIAAGLAIAFLPGHDARPSKPPAGAPSTREKAPSPA